tara:strand:+ start:2057 stop:2767 length:711 start_codon:yes stop_codon:yes gene_type:complete
MNITEDITPLQTDAVITLHDLDLTKLTPDNTTTILYLANQLDNDMSKLKYNGNEYTAAPIKSEGFEINSSGTMPRPTLQVSNIGGTYNQTLKSFNSLLGATLTRYKVFYKYLDDKDKGGLGAFISKDRWVLNKKTKHNKNVIQWEMKNPLDLETVMIPRGQFTRSCAFRYRRLVNDVFVQGTCAYTGDAFFDELGNVTSKKNDQCGKRFDDCVKRFQAVDKTADVPGAFFPLIPRF